MAGGTAKRAPRKPSTREQKRAAARAAARAGRNGDGPAEDAPAPEQVENLPEGGPQLEHGIFVGIFPGADGPTFEYVCVGDVRTTEAVHYLSQALAKAERRARTLPS